MNIEMQPSARTAPLSYLAWRIQRMNARVGSIPGKLPEIIAIVLYALGHLVMAVFHEPWYDEAVAWQIARCASIRDILLEIPHYEGHPPLWHLILLPFAKSGAPYELSLTLVSLAFSGAAVALILWKSPFPRTVRLLLPFTYFFFYQYSVISRPYCVMMLAFMLLALSYHARNEKPGRYTLSLMLLCLSSAYGIVIAGGLALVWCFEIWRERRPAELLRSIPKDHRIWWLAALLLLALLLIVQIMPRSDTFASNEVRTRDARNSFVVRLIYMLFTAISDVLFSAVYNSGYLRLEAFPPVMFAIAAMIGACVLCIIGLYGRRNRTLALFAVPFVLFALFGSIVYICIHHIGILLLFLIFWIWITCTVSEPIKQDSAFSQKHQGLFISIDKAVTVLALVAMAVSLFWTASSVALDTKISYAVGRNIASYIKENNLDQYSIMTYWQVLYDEEENVVSMNTELYGCTDNISTYFDENIFYNVMHGSESKNYTSHRVPSDAENIESLEQWKTHGYPDVLYMRPKLDLLWDESELSYEDYTLVFSEINVKIWKYDWDASYAELYVRNDLAAALGLEKVNQQKVLDAFLKKVIPFYKEGSVSYS